MANAEKLLHEAQYAFASISFGESVSNRRHAFRAKTLCRKIVRQFPGSTEAYEAHAILRRLGEEAYTSNLSVRHAHQPQAENLRGQAERPRHTKRQPETTITSMEEVAELDWSAVLRWLASRPLSILVGVAVAAVFLFNIFGPFLLLPLIVLGFTGPLRRLLNLQQRDAFDALIKRVNAYVASRQ